MEYDFSALSFEELQKMESAIAKERDSRREARFTEMVDIICNAFNQLKKEFPFASLDINCPNCGVSLDLMNYFSHGLKPSDFCR